VQSLTITHPTLELSESVLKVDHDVLNVT